MKYSSFLQCSVLTGIFQNTTGHTQNSLKECLCCLPNFGCFKSFTEEVGCSLGTCNTFKLWLIDSNNFPRRTVTKKKLEPFFKFKIKGMVNKLWQSLTNALRIKELLKLIREVTQKKLRDWGQFILLPAHNREYTTAQVDSVVGFWKVPIVSLSLLLL
jgi:hypothetical protein